MRTALRLFSWAIACGVSLIAVGACSRSSDEEQIRELIATAEQAAEARDASDVMSLIAPEYRDSQGFDRAQLQSFLRGYFLTHPRIELLLRIAEIKIETPTRARARLELTVVGTQIGGENGTSLSGDSESLQVDFMRIDGEWRIARADRVRNE
jgi:hypothetical protein